jgi:hypothetical protein
LRRREWTPLVAIDVYLPPPRYTPPPASPREWPAGARCIQLYLGVYLGVYLGIGRAARWAGEPHDEHKDYDDARDLWLTSQGFRTLRFRNEQICRQQPFVLRTIYDALGP